MRDTKDIADAVFRIRDEHLAQMKKKRIRIEKACAAVSALAAAGAITWGALRFSSDGQKPFENAPKNIMVTTGTVTDIVTTATDTSEPVRTSSYTTAVKTTSEIKGTAVTSKVNSTASAISSSSASTVSFPVTTVSAAVRNTADAGTNNTQPQVTTDINDIDCEEVIRMKVIEVKKYLAALSAAAIASSAANITVNAEAMYTPKPIDSLADAVLYIEANTDNMDFDGSGKIDGFDAYALFTYMNEAESLPEGYAARCAEYGDFNKDGAIDTLDTDLFREICYLRYIQDDYGNYVENKEYLLPEDTEINKHVCRTVSPDAPAELREKLLKNVYVDESYTYGSDENRNSFIDYFFFNLRNSAFPTEYTFDKYNDAYYKRFLENYDADKYSFDINEDGVVDLKDLYDIYIYDVASADEDSQIQKSFYFGQFNIVSEVIDGQVWMHSDKVNTLRKLLPMSEEYKQELWDKCEPLYDYVYTFIGRSEDYAPLCDMTVFDIISRYIVSNTDIDIINTSSLYYVQYHGDIMLCDHSVTECFKDEVNWTLHKHFNKDDSQNDNIYERKESEKYHEVIADYDYMHDNDVLRTLIDEAKADLESGLKNDMFDINKDGEINYLDSFVFELYIDDISKGKTAEESILPADMWNFIDQKVELDHDNIAGTWGDFMLYECAVGFSHEEPQYKLDIYYLQLVEKKGLVDLSDIRPYIEQLCKGKEAGDVDLDGRVTAVDASTVLGYYADTSVNAEISNVTVAHMEYMADINTDGMVNSVDASEILAAYAENSVKE